MNLGWIALAALLISGGDDKIGKKKPAQIVPETARETLKQKGVHVKVEGKALEQSLSLEGIMRGDFSFLKGTVHLFLKADKTLVESENKYLPPDELGGAEGGIGAATKNPGQMVAEFGMCPAKAKFEGDEKVGEVECKVVTAEAEKDLIVRQVREISSKVKEAKTIGDMSAMLDKQQSTSKYKAWIGKSDLKIYKMEWALNPKFVIPPGLPVPPGATDFLKRLEGTYTVTFADYNKDIDVEVPKEVKKKLGVK
jgi:hypothetical protein